MGKEYPTEERKSERPKESLTRTSLTPENRGQIEKLDPCSRQPAPTGVSEAVTPTAVVRYTGVTSPHIQWSLTDPFVQKLNRSSHIYLHHFATKLCADIVACDGPSNPMRDLVAATSSYPFLLQILVAGSALHVFNLSGDPVIPSSVQVQEEEASDPNTVKIYKVPNQKFYRDALAAKQEALKLLAQSITVVNESSFDFILTTVLMFINYDLVESGTDQWKVHMEGARRIISLLGSPPYQAHTMSSLRTFLLSDFLVYHILGSTFRFLSSPQLFPGHIDVGPILQYAETNNYLSCPAPLLSIMLGSVSLTGPAVLCDDMSVEQQIKLKTLIEEALAFDPATWISTFRPASPLDDLEKRLHMAAAHRSAVCIYLARYIPYTHPLLDPAGGQAVVSLTELAHDIVFHISQITPKDNLFKSINWPLFLAGAESEDPAERAWILGTLDTLYDAMRWGYIQTNKRILKSIWEFKAQGSTCWVTDIMGMGTEMLIA